MERAAVLAKTAKGMDEIKARAHGLPQKLRAILIMVNGNTTAGDLLGKFGGIPEVEQSLDALVAQGFAEIRSIRATAEPAARVAATPAASAAAAQAPVGARAGPATEPQTREAALSTLVRFLHENLGPDADLVTGQLERARSRADFAAAAGSCADMLAGVRGAAKAQVFRDRVTAFTDLYVGA